MRRYRQKTKVVEAVEARQCTVENIEELLRLLAWCNGYIREEEIIGNTISVRTSKGIMRCEQDDWIIKSVNGEFYSCASDIFRETYEPVDLDISHDTLAEDAYVKGKMEAFEAAAVIAETQSPHHAACGLRLARTLRDEATKFADAARITKEE